MTIGDYFKKVEGESLGSKYPNIEHMNMKKNPVVDPREETSKSHKEEDKKESVEIDEEMIKNEEPRSDTLITMKIPPLFPQRNKIKEENYKIKKFMAKLINISINIPLLADIQEILGNDKIMKKLMSKKSY